MTVWMLDKTLSLLNSIAKDDRNKLFDNLNVSDKEMILWKDIIKKIALHISDDGIIAQYDGYFDLEELDWDYYRKKYKNIYRMDRLLKAEGKSPDAYKAAKQAVAQARRLIYVAIKAAPTFSHHVVFLRNKHIWRCTTNK